MSTVAKSWNRLQQKFGQWQWSRINAGQYTWNSLFDTEQITALPDYARLGVHALYGTPETQSVLLIGIATSGPVGVPVTVTSAEEARRIFGAPLQYCVTVNADDTSLVLPWVTDTVPAVTVDGGQPRRALSVSEDRVAFAAAAAPLSATLSSTAGSANFLSEQPLVGISAGMSGYKLGDTSHRHLVTAVSADGRRVTLSSAAGATETADWRFLPAPERWMVQLVPRADRWALAHQAAFLFAQGVSRVTLLRVNGAHEHLFLPTVGPRLRATNGIDDDGLTLADGVLLDFPPGSSLILADDQAVQHEIIGRRGARLLVAPTIDDAHTDAEWVLSYPFVLAARDAGPLAAPGLEITTGMRGQVLLLLQVPEGYTQPPLVIDLGHVSTLGQLAAMINQYSRDGLTPYAAYAPVPDAPAEFYAGQYTWIAGEHGVATSTAFTADPSRWYDQVRAALPMVDLCRYAAIHLPVLAES